MLSDVNITTKAVTKEKTKSTGPDIFQQDKRCNIWTTGQHFKEAFQCKNSNGNIKKAKCNTDI